jgi:hypothetical protein
MATCEPKSEFIFTVGDKAEITFNYPDSFDLTTGTLTLELNKPSGETTIAGIVDDEQTGRVIIPLVDQEEGEKQAAAIRFTVGVDLMTSDQFCITFKARVAT